MKIRIARKFHFCAGHRILGDTKCANPHGHNFYVELYVESDTMPSSGYIADLSILKKKVGGWIDQFWDHNFLVDEKDTDLLQALSSLSTQKKPFICPFAPTMESMAFYLLTEICPQVLHGTGVVVSKVVVHETENNYAEAIL